MKVLVLAGALLFVPEATQAAITVTLAELKGGQLRLEGNGAVPNASLFYSTSVLEDATLESMVQEIEVLAQDIRPRL